MLKIYDGGGKSRRNRLLGSGPASIAKCGPKPIMSHQCARIGRRRVSQPAAYAWQRGCFLLLASSLAISVACTAHQRRWRRNAPSWATRSGSSLNRDQRAVLSALAFLRGAKIGFIIIASSALWRSRHDGSNSSSCGIMAMKRTREGDIIKASCDITAAGGAGASIKRMRVSHGLANRRAMRYGNAWKLALSRPIIMALLLPHGRA